MEQPADTPAGDVDWRAIQAGYELSRVSVRIIAAQYGLHPSAINRRVRKENWIKRQTYTTRSAEERIVRTVETVKHAIVRKLTALGNRIELPHKIDAEDPLRAITVLTTALQKITNIQYKDNHVNGGDRGDRVTIDDDTRADLAHRLEQMGSEWRAARTDSPA